MSQRIWLTTAWMRKWVSGQSAGDDAPRRRRFLQDPRGTSPLRRTQAERAHDSVAATAAAAAAAVRSRDEASAAFRPLLHPQGASWVFAEKSRLFLNEAKKKGA